jgi:methylenetetrahydrofolate--tRNA-(uracil-5-)-methyltransferase
MNVNFGLFPPIEGRPRKADRKGLMAARARADLAEWVAA